MSYIVLWSEGSGLFFVLTFFMWYIEKRLWSGRPLTNPLFLSVQYFLFCVLSSPFFVFFSFVSRVYRPPAFCCCAVHLFIYFFYLVRVCFISSRRFLVSLFYDHELDFREMRYSEMNITMSIFREMCCSACRYKHGFSQPSFFAYISKQMGLWVLAGRWGVAYHSYHVRSNGWHTLCSR